MIKIKSSIERQKVENNIALYFEDWDVDLKYEGEKLNLSIKVNGDYSQCQLYLVLSDIVEEIIIDELIDDIIQSRVNRIYRQDRMIVNTYAINRIKDEIKTSDAYLDEKIKMKDDIVSFIKENNQIDIDGYLQFRLKNYLYILDIAIDNIVTEIKEEKEIQDILYTIQHIVDTNPSKENILHLILKNGDFYFKDIGNNIIGSDIINKVKRNFDKKLVSKSDILLSSLILISPRQLVVHSDCGEDSFLIKAIKEIFENKVLICKGCSICKIDEGD